VSRMRARVERELAEWDHRAAIEEALRAPRAPQAPCSAAADPRRLRGIPMIGGGTGAIPGTVPGRGHIEQWSGRGRATAVGASLNPTRLRALAALARATAA
jgi:hypothetical protein